VKLQRFQELFTTLDSDGDGSISAQRIDIAGLSAELLEVLTPLFCEMEELGQSLDEEEFIDACCRLYESLSLPEKNVLVNQRQKWDSSKQQSVISQQQMFKPSINPNSLRIASKKRQPGDVADQLIAKHTEYQLKIAERQQEKENSELVGCTFHPKIIQSPMSTNRSMRTDFFSEQAIDMNNMAKNAASEVLTGGLFRPVRLH